MQNLLQNLDENDSALKVFQHLGNFHEAAVQAAKILVADLQMPSKKRKVSKLSDFRFVYKNILLHLAWEQDPPVRFKTLGHEFRSTQLLNEAIFFLNKENDFALKIPLTALIDFKGFRILAVSIVPIDTSLTIIHGLKEIDYFLSDSSLFESLSSLSQLLNVKEQVFQWDSGIVPVTHLSVFSQIHESLGYCEIENLEGYVEENKFLYITQTADILPLDLDFNTIPSDFTKRLRPEFFSEYQNPLTANGCVNLTEPALEEDDYELCEASLKVRTDKITEIVELLDSLTIMPIDSRSFTHALHSNGINCRYIGLIAQRTALPHIKDLCHVEIIARTCKRILFQQLVDLIFEIEENRKDLESHLESSHVHVTDIEGNYFRLPQQELETFDFAGENISNVAFRKFAFEKRFELQLKWPGYKEIKEKIKESQAPSQNFTMEGSLKDGVIDYLNLVFGAGEESEIFWEEILIKKAASHFSISEEKLDKSQVNLHALLHSICFHSGLSLDFSKDTLLGKTENPFTSQSLERIKEKSKNLKLSGIESKLMQDLLQVTEEKDQILESSLLSLKISKLLNQDPEFLGDTILLAQIGEALVERKEYEAGIQYAKDSLMQTHPLHAEGVKSWCILIRAMMASGMQDEALQCFDHALTALEYHWGPYHPLHCTLYSILAYLYMDKGNFEDALILYKNSLMCSLRVLGPNHPHTAEVYIELGTLYVQQGNIPDALNAIEKGFFVYEASLGKYAHATLTTAGKLALLHFQHGTVEKSREFIEKTIIGYEKIIQGLVEQKDVNSDQVFTAVQKIEEVFEIAEKYCSSAGDSKFERFLRNKVKEVKKLKAKWV
jgi:tetratricopeptide (TPR) repeat protein